MLRSHEKESAESGNPAHGRTCCRAKSLRFRRKNVLMERFLKGRWFKAGQEPYLPALRMVSSRS